MKYSSSILYFLLFVVSASFGQNSCGTIFDEEAKAKFFDIPYAQRTAITNTEVRFEIPLNVVIFRTNASTQVISKHNFDIALCELNESFDSLNIYFYLTDTIKYITNSISGVVNNFSDARSMASNNNVQNKVNVYIGNISGTGACGFAWYPGTGPTNGGLPNTEGGMFLSPGCMGSGSRTWAHEFGHYLFLPHPFDGTSSNPSGINAERVTRNNSEVFPRLSANCQSAGDGFCDTPADFLGYRFNCTGLRITQTDYNNDLFQPNTSLIMGYGNNDCRGSWTSEQIAMMRFTVQNLRQYLLNQAAPPTVLPITAAPILLSPADSMVVTPNNVSFNFSPVPNATKYLVQFNRVPTFSSSIGFDTTVAVSTFTINNNRFLQNNHYYWRVKPLNESYPCAPFTESSFFFTDIFLGDKAIGASKNTWAIYPSLLSEPSKILNIGATSGSLPNLLQVFDLNGRLLFSKVLDEFSNNDLQTVDISSLKNGIYFVELKNDNNRSVFKIVLQ